MSNPIVTTYTRCSTDKQDVSVADQLRVIGPYCEAKQYNLVHPDRYSDDGISGTTFEKRPGVMRLINDVRGGRHTFSRVIIYDESRWGRPEDADDSTYFELELKRRGVLIEYVLSQNSPGIVGRIERVIRYDQASDFSKKLGITVARGGQTAVRGGYSPGGYPPIGYMRVLLDEAGNPVQILDPGKRKALKDQKVRFVLGKPEEVALVRRIFKMALIMGVRQIGRVLNREKVPAPDKPRWTYTTVFYILNNRTYLGERSWGGTKHSRVVHEKVVCTMAHEPIIDLVLWDEVHSRMKGRGKWNGGNNRKSKYLLTSKMVCLKCGYNFTGKQFNNRLGKVYRYYQCSGFVANGVCSSFLIRKDPIERFVIEAIKEFAATGGYRDQLKKFIDRLKEDDGQKHARIKALRKEARAIDQEVDRIQDELLKIPSKSLRKRLMERETRREELDRLIEAAEKAPDSNAIMKNVGAYLSMVERIGRTIDTAPIEEQKHLVSLFVNKGEVDRKKMVVRFHFYTLPAATILSYPLDSPHLPFGEGLGSEDGHKHALPER